VQVRLQSAAKVGASVPLTVEPERGNVIQACHWAVGAAVLPWDLHWQEGQEFQLQPAPFPAAGSSCNGSGFHYSRERLRHARVPGPTQYGPLSPPRPSQMAQSSASHDGAMGTGESETQLLSCEGEGLDPVASEKRGFAVRLTMRGLHLRLPHGCVQGCCPPLSNLKGGRGAGTFEWPFSTEMCRRRVFQQACPRLL